MGLQFANKSIVPPDGYRFTCPETHYTIRSRDYWSWIDKIKAHYRANEIPLPQNIEDVAADQLCSQLAPEWCGRANETPWVNIRFGLGDVRDWLVAHLKLAVNGFKFVEQAEAERRAYICAACPNNVDTGGCGAHCHKLGELITGDIARRSTPYDADLKACAICHCLGSVQVHFPLNILEASDTPERQALYPSYCWKQRQSANYRPNEELAAA